jgi:hypothetical protein
MLNDEKGPRGLSGHPLALDPFASSAAATEPGFLARPAVAPVYHGFRVLSDVAVDGFIFGIITDFDYEACTEGDAFVIAPDNSRAGLVWKLSDKASFREIIPLQPERWGVWDVAFPDAMTSHENVRKNLQAVLPELKLRWDEWRQKYPQK